MNLGPQHDPVIPVPKHSAANVKPKPKAKSNPAQIRAYDDVDGRMELICLLKHLSPARRLMFFRWVCSQAILPGTYVLHPLVAPSTVALADRARTCDRADERLTMDIVSSCAHMWIDYDLDARKTLDKLVEMARGK